MDSIRVALKCIKTKHSTRKWKIEQIKFYNMCFDSNVTQSLKGKDNDVFFLGKGNSLISVGQYINL